MEVSSLKGSPNSTSTLLPHDRSSFVEGYLAQYIATIQVFTPFWPAIILFGYITNIDNMIVFLKSGTNDKVDVLLISLAVSDLTSLTLISPTA